MECTLSKITIISVGLGIFLNKCGSSCYPCHFSQSVIRGVRMVHVGSGLDKFLSNCTWKQPIMVSAIAETKLSKDFIAGAPIPPQT